jgi:TolB protein
MNSDGTGLRRITFNSTADRAPSISADGSKIAYTSFPEHQLSGEIYTMNSDGSGQRRLTFTSTPDFAPSISADGSKIAFESQRNNNWDIYTMNSDGTGLRRITFSSASDTQPSLSPDGNKIVYISDMDNARGEIYSIPLVGFPNITTRLTFGDGAARAPSVSTSGKIAYSYPSQLGRIGAQNWDIFTMNSDGTGKTRLTFGPADDYAPSLSPGASTIHYESDRDQDTREIYRMNSDGTGHTRLTFNSVPDTNAG